jgi:lipid-A-disaccharide synthase
VADEPAFKKFSKTRSAANKLVLAGNLMVDSAKYIECADDLPVNPDQPVITFLPGSRKFQIDYLIPYYLKVFKYLFQQEPVVQVVLSLSPFITLEQIEKAANNTIQINTSGKYPYFEYLDRTIYIAQKYYKNTDLAVTIPGTNTAQLALLGIPMLMIFPLDRPEVIPLEGIGNIIDKIPVLGKIFKKWVAHIAKTKIKYWALPNIKLQRILVPEMVGDVSPEQTAKQILLLLADKGKLAEMRTLLPTSFGPAGAAKKIVDAVISR